MQRVFFCPRCKIKLSTPLPPDDLPGEEWRSIPRYEGWYDASTAGRIRRVKGGRGTYAGRIVPPIIRMYRYLEVLLSADKERRNWFVHHLIALTFHGPRPEGAQVNHKDGVITNNRPENLEYVTRSQNTRHAYATGLTKPAAGEQHYKAKLTEQDVHAIRASAESSTTLSRRYGVSRTAVYYARQGRNWKHLPATPAPSCQVWTKREL